MTDMRRVTISLPERIDKKILSLRKRDSFARSSYAEIVRWALERGLELTGKDTDHDREEQKGVGSKKP